MALEIRFWGVRGSTPCCGDDYERFGGHTSCVSVQVDDTLVIFDAGTGIFDLGNWVQKKEIKRASLLLSHVHLDHIVGFPFFKPLSDFEFNLDVISGTLEKQKGIETYLEEHLFDTPLFPVRMEQLKAQITYWDVGPKENFTLNKTVKVTTIPLNHPGGAMGYRLDAQGKSVCYVTDTEHTSDQRDPNILEAIQGSDLLIYDTTFTDEEYKTGGYIGWGHSTWEEGIRLCKQANVKNLALFHHSPTHTDPILREIEQEAYNAWPGTLVTYQGMKLCLD